MLGVNVGCRQKREADNPLHQMIDVAINKNNKIMIAYWW